MRDKDSKAITITIPAALDRELQRLADKKHCGNKSSAIRQILYREAGVENDFRIAEPNGAAKIKEAERRAVKYGTRREKKK